MTPEQHTQKPCLTRFVKWRSAHDDGWQALWRGFVSEFFATTIFVFIGCGSVVAAQVTLGAETIDVSAQVLISLAHGFTIMVMIYSIGEISGGHINPAVTWATVITRKLSVLRGICYIIAQLVGAIFGAALLEAILPESLRSNLGCHILNVELLPIQGYFAEVIFTFIFIFVVFATAISPFAGKLAPLQSSDQDYGPGKLTPFAVGMAILILHTVGIPITGASMNPARSFGPAVIADCWKDHWIYWLGPLTGSTIACIVASAIFLSNPNEMAHIAFQITRRKTGRSQNKFEENINEQGSINNENIQNNTTENKTEDPAQFRHISLDQV